VVEYASNLPGISVHPILIDIAEVTISSYTVMLAIAVVVSVSLTVREAERRGLAFTYPMAVPVLLGGLVGARAFWILQFDEPIGLWRAVMVWSPGLVLYGGILGGIAALLAILRVRKAPIWPTFDVVAPHAALGEGIARIGCFLAGCCWGRACTVPWGVRFPAGSLAHSEQWDAGLLDGSAHASLSVHPTQLYMAIGLAIAYAVLRLILRRQDPAGSVLAAYFAFYGVLRFAVEAFRGDSARPILGMTVSQALSVALAAVGFVAMFVLWRQKHDAPPHGVD
jgi:phosphatidylglycerol:prolipoprotein diacylglycerol transferase